MIENIIPLHSIFENAPSIPDTIKWAVLGLKLFYQEREDFAYNTTNNHLYKVFNSTQKVDITVAWGLKSYIDIAQERYSLDQFNPDWVRTISDE